MTREMTLDEAIKILDPETSRDTLMEIMGGTWNQPRAMELLQEAQRMGLEALRAQQNGGWISVKDRLPEIGEKVLTLDKWGHIHDRTLYQFDGIPKTTLFRPDGLAPGKDITHWQPLPEPPKGE